MKYLAIISTILLASCTQEVTVHHEIEPIQVAPAPVVAPVETAEPAPIAEPVEVAETFADGVYTLTDFTIINQGYTFDAETAMTFMPFSSYHGTLTLYDGVAEFAFFGTIGEMVVEQRSDTWTYSETDFTDDGIIQVYYKNGQLQIRDETRASVDSITYTFMILSSDAEDNRSKGSIIMELVHNINVDNKDNAVSGMLKLLSTGFACIQQAAETYAALIQRHGANEINAMLAESAPSVTATFWRRLQSVGEQAMDSRLLYGSASAHAKLRRLPRCEQETVLDTGVMLYRDGAQSDDDALLVKLDSLNPYQTKMVFADDHVRTIAEQRIWAENECLKRAHPKENAAPFSVRGHKVIINKGCTLSHSDLIRLVQETA